MTKKKSLSSFQTKIETEKCEERQAAACIQYISAWGREALATAPILADVDRAYVTNCIEIMQKSFLDLAELIEPLKASPVRYEAALQRISKLVLSAHGVGLAASSSGPGRQHARALHTFKMREAAASQKAASTEEAIIQSEIASATDGWDGKRPSPSRLAADICDRVATRGGNIGTDAMYDRLKKYLQEPFKGSGT